MSAAIRSHSLLQWRRAPRFTGCFATSYGRSAIYRQIHLRSFPSDSHQILRASLKIPEQSPIRRAAYLPLLLPRHISSASLLRQEVKNGHNNAPKSTAQDSQSKASDGHPATDSTTADWAQADPEDAKSREDPASSQSSGEEQGHEDGDKAKNEKRKEKRNEPPPPPPHGNKTPWQVFTETLNSEFKKSSEWQESTKALSSGYNELAQNESLRKARSAYSQASEAATSTTSAALKTTGKAIGQGAGWAWDTAPVRGMRKGATAAGSGLEKATRPLRETEAYKNVKDVIDDGSSSKYGGWVEKEERRRKRELRELKEQAKSGTKDSQAPMEEDPNAGTNITVHKDAAWKDAWRDFRDSSRIMQSFSGMKATYRESENPLISTARSVSDAFTGFFAENETAHVIKAFREMDPSFQVEPFLQEMRDYILPEVLDAYVKGDVATLQLWLSSAQYEVYAALMKQYTQAGLKSDGRILDIRHVDISSARLLEPSQVPVFIITCRTQEVHVYRDKKTNALAAGMEDKVQQVSYAIGITRIPEEVNNKETRGWRLIELHKQGRDYI